MAQDLTVNGAQVKVRNVLGVLGLGIITCGIYSLYHWHAMNRELRDFGQGRIDVNPTMSLLALFPGAFLIVPAFVTIHKTGKRIEQAQEMSGTMDRISIPLMWVLVFVSGLYTLYMQHSLNQLWKYQAMNERDGMAPATTATAATPTAV